ncbi:hypothetical protein [Parvularcula maris]|nr:hypothetical protein [Parvularcula maris]
MLALLLLAACTATEPETPSSDRASVAMVADVELSDGQWQADLMLPMEAQAVLFDRALGTRAERWALLTEGASLQNIGGFDAVTSDRPLTELSFRVLPHTEPIRQDYTPFIPFSDGSAALFTGQFGLLSAENVAAIEAMGGDLSRSQGVQFPLLTRITADRPMVTTDGVIEPGRTYETEGGTFVYVGGIEPFESGNLTLVTDPGLPPWLTDDLDTALAKVFDAHTEGWGRRLADGALLFLAFRGAEKDGFSSQGSVAGRVLGASLSGRSLLRPNPAIRDYLTWFYAHEAAHLYQNDAGTPVSNAPEAWMHEGAASYLANRITEELSPGHGGFRQSQDKSAANCAETLSESDGVTIDGGGGTYQIAYDCGAVIAEITDLLTPMRLEAFWTEAGEAYGRTKPFTTEAFFGALETAGAREEGIAALRGFITQPQPDAADAIADLYSVAEGIR